MNDWEAHYPDGRALVKAAYHMIFEELGKIRYVNLKIKIQGEKESRWYFETHFALVDDRLVLSGNAVPDGRMSVPVNQIEYLRLRPYYYAICVGFKNFIFYNDATHRGGSV